MKRSRSNKNRSARAESNNIREIARLAVKTLNQMGVAIRSMDPDKDPPEFKIVLVKSHLIQSEEDTLKSAYGILWTMVHGKVNDLNRDKKIDLLYEVK